MCLAQGHNAVMPKHCVIKGRLLTKSTFDNIYKHNYKHNYKHKQAIQLDMSQETIICVISTTINKSN